MLEHIQLLLHFPSFRLNKEQAIKFQVIKTAVEHFSITRRCMLEFSFYMNFIWPNSSVQLRSFVKVTLLPTSNL